MQSSLRCHHDFHSITPKSLSYRPVNQLPSTIAGTEYLPLPNGSSFTGYANMAVTQANGSVTQNSLFYWFFKSRTAALTLSPTTIPMVIWLNGGPGISSLTGLFMENGPLQQIDDATDTIQTNPDSWNRECHLLYWDQPVGTGYSFTDSTDGYVTNQEELRQQFCVALDMFFANPQFSAYKNSPLYIVGEGYAGKYISNIACELMERADQYPHVATLAGIAIGDGWIQPRAQTRAQIEYSYASGRLDTKQYLHLGKLCNSLNTLISDGEFRKANQLGRQIMDQLLANSAGPNAHDTKEQQRPRMTALSDYLNNANVRKALAAVQPWIYADNGGKVTASLGADIYAPAYQPVLDVLEYARRSKLQVMFYTGQSDNDCGFWGTEQMLWDINFPRLTGIPNINDATCWQQLDRQVWVDTSGATLGFIKSLGNLTQATVVNRGHCTPTIRRDTNRALIANWISKRPFAVINPAIGEKAPNSNRELCVN